MGSHVQNCPPIWRKRVPRLRLTIPPFLLAFWNTRRHPPEDPSAGAGGIGRGCVLEGCIWSPGRVLEGTKFIYRNTGTCEENHHRSVG